MIDVDTFEKEHPDRPGVSIERSSNEEPPRTLSVIPGSTYLPTSRSVRTTLQVLDISAAGYSLRHRHLIDPDRRVIYEREVVPSFPLSRIAVMPLERPSHLDGVVACLCQAPNYGHWNLLALPLVSHYRRVLGTDPDYYYVGSPLSSWQLESLRLLGIPESRLVQHAVTADRILVAIADRSGDVDTEFLLYADRALSPAPSPPRTPSRRLFVSRARASRRRLVNERACAGALAEAFGLELVATEGMSLSEEIALFREAELVVGASGAGLTNAIFAPSGSALIQLAPENPEDSLISQIAAAKNLRYGFLRGQPVGLRIGVPAGQCDFTVNVQSVTELVRSALSPEG
jgi:hypothetical protein